MHSIKVQWIPSFSVSPTAFYRQGSMPLYSFLPLFSFSSISTFLMQVSHWLLLCWHWGQSTTLLHDLVYHQVGQSKRAKYQFLDSRVRRYFRVPCIILYMSQDIVQKPQWLTRKRLCLICNLLSPFCWERLNGTVESISTGMPHSSIILTASQYFS